MPNTNNSNKKNKKDKFPHTLYVIFIRQGESTTTDAYTEKDRQKTEEYYSKLRKQPGIKVSNPYKFVRDY